MEPSTFKYITAVFLLLLGIFYSSKPEVVARFFNEKLGVKYTSSGIKIGGIVLIIVGMIQILLMLKVLPKFY